MDYNGVYGFFLTKKGKILTAGDPRGHWTSDLQQRVSNQAIVHGSRYEGECKAT